MLTPTLSIMLDFVIRSLRLFPVLAVLSCSSCVYTPQYGSPAGGGGYYMSQQEHSAWNINWGLVKASGAKAVRPAPATDYFWRGDGVSGSPRIVIDLSDQRARFYKGGVLVGDSPVCTGSPRFPTPRGSFSVIDKDQDHYSSVYGDYIDKQGNVLRTNIDRRKDRCPPGGRFDGAKMFWFMRVVGGVGMHEGYLPGYADSHGCIRLPSEMARTYYQNAPHGTPVRIVE